MSEDPIFPLETSTFHYTISGVIESADFYKYNNLYCKYSFVHGTDWTTKSGLTSGITQIGSKRKITDYILHPEHSNQTIIWNFPIELTFSSNNPFGWPQIVISIYGPDLLGRDIVRGYGARHLPSQTGRHELTIPTFVPQSSTLFQHCVGILLGRRPEFITSRFVAQGNGRDVTRVTSNGSVKIKCDVIIQGLQELGYIFQ